MLVPYIAATITSYLAADAFAAAVVAFTPKLLTTKSGIFGVVAVGTATTIGVYKLTVRAVEKIYPE